MIASPPSEAGAENDTDDYDIAFDTKARHGLWRHNGKASYKAYKPEDLVELDRAKLYGVYLVRIDLVHSIHNYSDTNYRWCFSLKDATNRWTWEQAVEYFTNE